MVMGVWRTKKTLREYDLSNDYCAIIEEIFGNRSFQALCGDTLYKKYNHKGDQNMRPIERNNIPDDHW